MSLNSENFEAVFGVFVKNGPAHPARAKVDELCLDRPLRGDRGLVRGLQIRDLNGRIRKTLMGFLRRIRIELSGSILPVNTGAGRIAHSDQEMSESRVKFKDVLCEIAESFLKSSFYLGIIVTDLRGRRRSGL